MSNRNTHKYKHTSVHNMRNEENFSKNTYSIKYLKQFNNKYHSSHHSYIQRNIEHEENKIVSQDKIFSVSFFFFFFFARAWHPGVQAFLAPGLLFVAPLKHATLVQSLGPVGFICEDKNLMISCSGISNSCCTLLLCWSNSPISNDSVTLVLCYSVAPRIS